MKKKAIPSPKNILWKQNIPFIEGQHKEPASKEGIFINIGYYGHLQRNSDYVFSLACVGVIMGFPLLLSLALIILFVIGIIDPSTQISVDDFLFFMGLALLFGGFPGWFLWQHLPFTQKRRFQRYQKLIRHGIFITGIITRIDSYQSTLHIKYEFVSPENKQIRGVYRMRFAIFLKVSKDFNEGSQITVLYLDDKTHVLI